MAEESFRPEEWSWWQAALTDTSRIGVDLPVWDSQPFTGFFRTKDAHGRAPVAFWYADGVLHCRIADKAVSEEYARDQWSWTCRQPVTHAAYLQKVETGVWPDEVVVEVNGEQQSSHEKPKRKPAVKKVAAPVKAEEQAPATVAPQENERATIGHNSGDAGAIDPEFENLREEIDKWKRQLDALLKNGDPSVKQEADKVSDMGDKLGELEKRADSMRDAEGRPFLEAKRAVDAKFKPLIVDADEAKRRAKRSLKPFLKQLQDEADAKRREEDERRLEESAEGLDTTPQEQRREAPKAQVGNRRSTSIIKRKVAVIDDNVVLATFLLTGLSSPLLALVDEMKKAAERMLKAGAPVKAAATVQETAEEEVQPFVLAEFKDDIIERLKAAESADDVQDILDEVNGAHEAGMLSEADKEQHFEDAFAEAFERMG